MSYTLPQKFYAIKYNKYFSISLFTWMYFFFFFFSIKMSLSSVSFFSIKMFFFFSCYRKQEDIRRMFVSFFCYRKQEDIKRMFLLFVTENTKRFKSLRSIVGKKHPNGFCNAKTTQRAIRKRAHPIRLQTWWSEKTRLLALHESIGGVS